jgi:hypothetical protein
MSFPCKRLRTIGMIGYELREESEPSSVYYIMPTIMVREGTIGKHAWKQFMVITDQRVALVEMTPAILGWNIGKVTVQSGEDWASMDESAIVAWKLRNDDKSVVVAPESLSDFLPKLLKVAG